MLELVEVSTKQGKTLSLPLRGANGYLIQDIEGLDPVKASLVSTSFAQVDGEQYQASRREARNIVFKMGLDVSQAYGSVAFLRKRLSSFFPLKAEIKLRFISDEGLTVDIYGIVESFVSPLFSKEPDATISVMCHKPDFVEEGTTTVSGVTTLAPSEWVIPYSGDVETGIILRVMVDRNLWGFTVAHRSSEDKLSSLEFEAELVAGDVVTISTIPGSKGATLTRSSHDSSILYGISPYSNWISLFPGDNHIGIIAEGAGVPYTIEYTTRHGGL